MSLLKKIKDKTGTIHDLGDSRVDSFETELSGAEHNVPYSPAVLNKTNAIESKIDTHTANVSNPHNVTKEQLGLANVENKSSTQIRSELTKENVTTALGYTPIDESKIGAANGVASLDASGRIPASQIPGGFDNIEEYDSLSDFPETGEEGKIYVAKDSNLTYRWTGTQYIEISPSLALGETATTAYRGDRGKIAYDHSQVSGNSTIHHTHSNKELLDTYTQTEADLANAVAKVHEHGNKEVLDGISAEDVTNWDGKQDKITSTGSSTFPVYFTNGVAKQCSIELGNLKSDLIYGSSSPLYLKLYSLDYSSSAGYRSGIIIKWSAFHDSCISHGELHIFKDSKQECFNLVHTNIDVTSPVFYLEFVDTTTINIYCLLQKWTRLYLAKLITTDKLTTLIKGIDSLPDGATEIPSRFNTSSETLNVGSTSSPVYISGGIAKEATGVATSEALTAETTARTEADTALQANIDTKQDKLTNTDSEIQGAVANSHTHDNKEVLDGISAENISQWNADKSLIEAEVERATNAENTLQTKIDTKQDSIPTYSLSVDGEDLADVIDKIVYPLANSNHFFISADNNVIAERTTNIPSKVINSFRAECFSYWSGVANSHKKSVMITLIDASSNSLFIGKYINTGITYSRPTISWLEKQNALTFDTTPTTDSTNPVTSDGIKTAIDTEATARTEADTALGGRIDTVDAKGITIEEIDGEQVICFG